MSSHNANEAGTPFPRLPMFAIAVGLVSHAYSLSSLFPYVGYMVQYLGVTDDKDEAGYYAGYLSSAFMVGRFASSYFWGRFADIHGRLPVVYIGLSFIGLMSLSFGLSTSFWWALASRFLLGALNGLVAIAKCLVSEVCGKEHEVVGMGFVTACWSFGTIIGPGLGGLLAEPAKHYPSMFSEMGLFGRYPYLLPNVVGAGLAFSALPLVYFFLEETANLTNDITDGRAGFKPLPTTEADGVGNPEASMEEGRSLEMTPLTQQNSDDTSDGGNYDDKGSPGPEGSHSDADYDSGGGSFDSAVRLGAETEPAVHVIGKNGGGKRSRSDGSGDHNAGAAARRDGNSSVVVAHFGTQDPRDCNTSRGGADAGLERRGGMDEEISTTETTTTTTTAWRAFLVPLRLLQEKRVRGILFVNTIFSFAIIGFGEVYPLWALSTVANGGLDWTTKQIGQFIDMGVDALFPLWAISTVASGGLDWSTNNVGQVLSICGVGMLSFQLLIYPWLSKRMGATLSQRSACLLSVPVFLCFPFLSRLRGSKTLLVVGSILFNFLSSVTANAVFINVALATNNAVHSSRRATVNGLSMMLGSLGKAGGPVVFSAIFAWSIDGGQRPFPLDYHLVFYLLALSMVAVSWSSWNVITDDPPPPRQEPKASAGDGDDVAKGRRDEDVFL